jgi:hypothetical protein
VGWECSHGSAGTATIASAHCHKSAIVRDIPVSDTGAASGLDPFREAMDKADHHPEKLSELLIRLSRESVGGITVRQMAEAMDERSFGAFLIIFSMPNLIPLPPGATLILGLPLVFIGWQMVIGRSKIWLPNRIADYRIDQARFEQMVGRVAPWLKWLETFVRPRRWPLDHPLAERLFSLYIFLLGIVVTLPIPFGNWLPAFALCIIGVAHTERDGYSLAAGTLIGIASLAIVVLVVMATGALLMQIF